MSTPALLRSQFEAKYPSAFAHKVRLDKPFLSTGIPNVPSSPNYVMFDLEGMPPHLNEMDKIYLWGVQVFGDKPTKFAAALAGFGANGDRHVWEEFLQLAKKIFDEYGDIPFVHWAAYEKTYTLPELRGENRSAFSRISPMLPVNFLEVQQGYTNEEAA